MARRRTPQARHAKTGRFIQSIPEELRAFMSDWRPFEQHVRLVEPSPENVLELPKVNTYDLKEL